MATPAEAKLLLAIVTSGTISSINWEPVANDLGCNKKAAAERWRVFKTKLPLPAGQAATDGQAKLLLAIVGSVQVSGINWEAVGNALGCNKKAAAERWRVFRVKREKMSNPLNVAQGEGEGGLAPGKKFGGGKVNGKAAAEKTSLKKRLVEDSEDEVAAAQGGPVGGSAKKQRVKSEKGEFQSVKAEAKDQEDSEEIGEETEREDEFYDAEGGDSGYFGDGEAI